MISTPLLMWNLSDKKNFKKFLVYNKLIIKIYKFAPLKTLKKNLYYG